ncbi:MAG: Lin0512 family protein [Oscillospiraceae bacterium]|nr:Lin0512 family protein [Oscillospiraceae bacterium]
MWKRYLVEFGTGADLHGMDMMEAAARAVRDAISHCCMCGLIEALGIKDLKNDMRVVMKIAAPDPNSIDPEALKKLMITDQVDVVVVQGGMLLNGLHVDDFGKGDQIVIVNAGLTVYARV